MTATCRSKNFNPDAVLDIKDRPKALPWLGLSLQHLFTMFGATVLVPILVGINPSIALVSSGIGTLVFGYDEREDSSVSRQQLLRLSQRCRC